MDLAARACEALGMDSRMYAADLRAIERYYAPAEGTTPEDYARQVEVWRQREGEREEVCSTGDATGWRLLRWLCARYRLRVFRRRRQKVTTLIVVAPKGFVTKVLWPQFQAMMQVFAEAKAEVDKEILVNWLGAEEATAPLSVEERDEPQ
jgi:hypothetical protein